MADPDPQPASDPATSRRRTVLFTAVGAVLAGVLLFAMVARSASTSSAPASGGTDTVGNRVARFDVGRAADRAKTIERDGPILFPDPQSRSRDIFVQYLGGTDWRAFEARAAGAPRRCVLDWKRDARQFVDPCDGRTYPADGTGLVSFPTTVDKKGRLVVDLGSPSGP